MGNRNRYYIIKRDKETNDYSIVSLNGKRDLSLEEIDISTSVDGLSGLSKSLEKDYKDKEKYDWFIASVSGNGKKIEYFDMSLDYYTLPRIAQASLNGQITARERDSDQLFGQFIFRMWHNEHFRSYVLSGYGAIFTKFIELLDSKSVNLHQGGGWPYRSYPLIRNVARALLDNYVFTLESEEKIKLRNLSRSLLDREILQEVNPKNDSNQMNFFSAIPITTDARKLELLSQLEQIDEDAFVIDKGRLKFNRNKVSFTDDEKLRFLENGLPAKARLIIHFYTMHTRLSKEDNQEYWDKHIRRDLLELCSWFDEDSNNIELFKRWLNLYFSGTIKTGDEKSGQYRKNLQD